MIVKRDLHVFADIDALALGAAKDFAKRSYEAIKNTGSFKVAFSGGNTPKRLFDILVSNADLGVPGPILWENIYIFWGDERYVPHDNPQSNYLMTDAHLLSKVPISKNHVYPIPTDRPSPEEAALEYGKTIQEVFQLKPGELPVFDLIYLGMGPDGHTASLFPGTDLVKHLVEGETSKTQMVAATWVSKVEMYRISFLPAVINNAKSINLLIAGADKAPALNSVINGKYQPLTYPIQLIQAKNGEQIWFVDKDAVSMLDNI